MTVRIGWIGALMALAMSCLVPMVTAQCCGDCDGDGTITIAELVGAVSNSLAGCSATARPLVVVRGVSLP